MKSRLFLILVSICFFAGFTQASDLYWISFNHHGTDNCFVMQIDQLGNVTKQPKVIYVDYHSHATAIANASSSRLIYWASSASSPNDILRTTVDKQTLKALKGKRLSVRHNDSDHLQATQGASTFFLGFEVADEILKGYQLDSSGRTIGNGFRLSPRTDGGNDDGGLAADGRIALSLSTDSPNGKLYVQPLQADGRPTGLPSVIGSGNLDSPDVTGVLPGNVRWVVYFDEDASEWFLQPVNASTGEKQGGPRSLGSANPDHSVQMVAIEPHGRFVILSDNAQPCDVSSMFYQALDSLGNPSGSRKEVVGCAFQDAVGDIHGIRAFDILQN